MYGDVLVTTDGSDHADRGVERALDLAEEHGANLHVVYVVDERRHGGTPAMSSYEAALEKEAERGEAIAGHVVARANQRGLSAEVAVRRGVPHEEIRRYAEDNGVDVVVMGKRGVPGVEPPHVGSVTDRVERESEVPVLPV